MATLSLEKINAEIERLKAQALQIEAREKKAAIKTIKALLSQYQIAGNEIGVSAKSSTVSAKANKKKVRVVQFRKGNLTWSGGRGVKPKWVREVIAKEGKEALIKYKA